MISVVLAIYFGKRFYGDNPNGFHVILLTKLQTNVTNKQRNTDKPKPILVGCHRGEEKIRCQSIAREWRMKAFTYNNLRQSFCYSMQFNLI